MADVPYGLSPRDDAFTRTWANAQGPAAGLRAVNNGPIGRRFLVTGFTFFLLGGTQALFMRLQLARPENDWLTPELYNGLMTMHGSTMLFLFVVPILEGFATLIAPTMLGSRDLPFPRLTAFAYWAYLFGGILMYASFLVGAIPDGGWFAYVPLTGPEYSPGVNMDYWLLGLELAEAAGIISAFELIIAILAMRAPGMTLGRLPIFLWSMLVTSAMILFAFMTVLIASLYLELDRKVGTAFFDPERGGSPLLWQHLFWFFGHPEVYIQFLPAAGIVSTVVAVFARRPLASYTAVVVALVVTGVLSFGLWSHHMFTSGMPDLTAGFFSTMSIFVAIPTGVQFFVWIATLWSGSVVWRTPMWFAVGFFVIFLVGGLSGVMLGVAPFDWQVHDSYFVVAHFHYVLIGGVVFPLLAALYFWMPKIIGKALDERLGVWNFWLMFIGFHVAFFPMHFSGFLGMPRRVYTFPEGVGLSTLNLVSTVGALLFAAGLALFLVNLVKSSRGPDAPANPWGAYSLEWATTSPPPPYGFRTLPIVRSRYPLWTQDDLERGDPGDEAVVRTLAEWPVDWQGAIVTDVFTGRVREVFWLPNASYLPVILAAGLAGALAALIYDAYLIAGLGLAVAAVAYVMWVRPGARDAAHDPEMERRFARHGVRVYLHSSPTVARWACVLSLFILVVTGMTFAFSYLYLATRGAEGAWPPSGAALPGGATMLAAWVLVGLSVVPVAAAARAVRARLRRRAATGWLTVAFALGAAAMVLQVAVYSALPFGPAAHAYGSMVHLLWVFSAFALVVALGMATIAAVRLARNLDPDEVDRVRVSVTNAALAWFVGAALWLAVQGLLYVGGAP